MLRLQCRIQQVRQEIRIQRQTLLIRLRRRQVRQQTRQVVVDRIRPWVLKLVQRPRLAVAQPQHEEKLQVLRLRNNVLRMIRIA